MRLPQNMKTWAKLVLGVFLVVKDPHGGDFAGVGIPRFPQNQFPQSSWGFAVPALCVVRMHAIGSCCADKKTPGAKHLGLCKAACATRSWLNDGVPSLYLHLAS